MEEVECVRSMSRAALTPTAMAVAAIGAEGIHGNTLASAILNPSTPCDSMQKLFTVYSNETNQVDTHLHD